MPPVVSGLIDGNTTTFAAIHSSIAVTWFSLRTPSIVSDSPPAVLVPFGGTSGNSDGELWLFTERHLEFVSFSPDKKRIARLGYIDNSPEKSLLVLTINQVDDPSQALVFRVEGLSLKDENTLTDLGREAKAYTVWFWAGGCNHAQTTRQETPMIEKFLDDSRRYFGL